MKRALVILLAVIASAIAVVAEAERVPAMEAPASLGIGEELILVVADQLPSAEEARRAATKAGRRFGGVQGLYVDAASNYEVTGISVQVSADQVRVSCPASGGFAERVIDGVREYLDCPDGRASVRPFLPVRLGYVPRSEVSASSFPGPCGSIGVPPCQRDRYRALLGETLRFAPGAHLVLTAFRTSAGAESFVELARTLGVGGSVVVNARKLGGTFVGLGQEQHPDGSGPLLGPLTDQWSYQR